MGGSGWPCKSCCTSFFVCEFWRFGEDAASRDVNNDALSVESRLCQPCLLIALRDGGWRSQLRLLDTTTPKDLKHRATAVVPPMCVTNIGGSSLVSLRGRRSRSIFCVCPPWRARLVQAHARVCAVSDIGKK